MATLTPQQRRDRIYTLAKFALGGAVIFFLAPIIQTIVGGLVGLIVSVTLGLALYNFTPVMANMFATYKMKAIMALIAANPIEAITILLLEKEQEFEVAKNALTEARKASLDFAQRVEGFKIKYPARAKEFEEKRDAFNTVVNHQEKQLQEAQKAIKLLTDKREELKDLWEMAKSAQKASNAMKMTDSDIFAKIKEQAAVDSVMSSVNQVFADLATTAALETPTLDVPQLTHQPGASAQVINLGDRQNVA